MSLGEGVCWCFLFLVLISALIVPEQLARLPALAAACTRLLTPAGLPAVLRVMGIWMFVYGCTYLLSSINKFVVFLFPDPSIAQVASHSDLHVTLITIPLYLAFLIVGTAILHRTDWVRRNAIGFAAFMIFFYAMPWLAFLIDPTYRHHAFASHLQAAGLSLLDVFVFTTIIYILSSTSVKALFPVGKSLLEEAEK